MECSPPVFKSDVILACNMCPLRSKGVSILCMPDDTNSTPDYSSKIDGLYPSGQ